MRIQRQRNGATAILLCVLMVPLLSLLAFSVDYGFILFVKTDLQRVADQAAIAATQDLAPDPSGNQDLSAVIDRLREYVQLNLGDDFVIADSDINIGRYNPATIYQSVDLLDTGIYDTVNVTLRRSNLANSSLTLYFARMFGDNEADVSASATAVLQKARYLGPGADVFPFAIDQVAWQEIGQGDQLSIYGDGRIEDADDNSIPGNWGTVDIGPNSNSTNDLSNQIVDGLSQNDLDALHSQGSIPSPSHIDAASAIDLNGDTGLSAGLKHAVWEVEGSTRIAPIYQSLAGHGGNLTYTIVGWTAVKVVDSNWKGSKSSSIEVQKAYIYDKDLYPVNDLTDTTQIIEGAFTSPVLVE